MKIWPTVLWVGLAACGSSKLDANATSGGATGSSASTGTSSGGSSAGSSEDTSQGEEFGNHCPDQPFILTGVIADGGACSTAADCAPVCCSCTNGDTQTFSAAACQSGACAEANACAAVETTDGTAFCP